MGCPVPTRESDQHGSRKIDPPDTIEELFERGSQRGYVTYDEIAPFIDLGTASAEEIEAFMARLANAGIVLTDGKE